MMCTESVPGADSCHAKMLVCAATLLSQSGQGAIEAAGNSNILPVLQHDNPWSNHQGDQVF